jgi:hypothetical protein
MKNYLISGGYAFISAFVGMSLPAASAVGPIRNPTTPSAPTRLPILPQK